MNWWTRLPVGTRSLLVGAHAFWLHPWFVALAWCRLYGFRSVACPSSGVTTSLFDWRLWVCFIVHDLGYAGKGTMDGPDGEQHPELGAKIAALMDRPEPAIFVISEDGSECKACPFTFSRWRDFVRYHSRFVSMMDRKSPSLLCHADKAAIWLTPTWLYVPMARLSDELQEYRDRGTRPENSYGWNQAKTLRDSDWEWHRKVRAWAKSYAMEHKDGREDRWTAA